MNVFRGCTETSTLCHRDKGLKLLKVKIDACHASIVSKVAIYENMPLQDDAGR
jgi:hypothetical protein